MRTVQEIKDKIANSKDFFGFETSALVSYLPFADAKSMLKEGTTEEQWKPLQTPLTREAAINDIMEYMPFAWEKAENHRGISASRSVSKIGAWLWLLADDGKDDPAYLAFEAADYSPYGAPKLKAACIALGLPMPDEANVLRMAEGKPCRDQCNEGCRS